MTNKPFFLFGIFLLLTESIFAQLPESIRLYQTKAVGMVVSDKVLDPYYKTDTATFVGIHLIDGGELSNGQFCQVQKGDKISTFSPSEVKEFGFRDGTVYLSKLITINEKVQRVFLERLVHGKCNLYFYKGKNIKTFFLEKDSSVFIELPKKNKDNRKIEYNSQLQKFMSDCPVVGDASKLVNYNKNSLSIIARRYNSCENRPFPCFRYGILLGMEESRLSYDSQLINAVSQIHFTNTPAVVLGIFIDNPLFSSDVSFHSELQFMKHNYSFSHRTDTTSIDFIANTVTVDMPLLIRYTYPANKIRPFVNLGFELAHNFRYTNTLYQTTINQNKVEINTQSSNTLISETHSGYSVGSGIEYKLNFKNSIFFEFRYSKQFGLLNADVLNNSVIHFTISFNF